VRKQYTILKKLSPMTPLSSFKKRLAVIRNILLRHEEQAEAGGAGQPLQKCQGAKKGVPLWNNILIRMM
jgi:hypothetical protein